MCEAKPGTRCAADTRADAEVTLERYSAALPDGPPVNALTAGSATFEAADPDTPISVPDPDNPFDMPIYEGPASGAAEALMGGTYEAVDLDDEQNGPRYRLTVPGEAYDESSAGANACSYCAGVHSDFSGCNFPGAATSEISGEWAPDVKVAALTFPDSKQGFGDPVYWVTSDDLRRLQNDGNFANKAEFDLDMTSAFITFDEDGTPTECYRDGDDPDDYEYRKLECRTHNGAAYYSLEGYEFDA